ncbi:LmeA family phospholipid-binding protein [Streptomyces fulvoviolaceus]|uniref:LmeA family phospholipid-binding protein n=1 Tax=Streptomyces fulvoviolaceus TaxID=285535 RepID=UPI0021BF4172|nr:DUF2993 domain-containing protein [Streptomyces fulvoviolaceus]MCT9083706.1 DUF2993 domain-containing protein [Streptomyces fulvoviolaceus]
MQQPEYIGDAHPSYEPYAPYRPRWYRRPAVIAAAALCAPALVPVVVDRLAAARVESRTAEAFQQGMDTPLPPEVHVRGFPVLTQLASDTLRHVDITAHDIPAYDATRPLPVSELSLNLDDLTKSDDDSEAYARSAQATARLSYTDVSSALGLEVSQGSRPGQIRASVLLPPGNEVTVTTTVSAASGNRIAFKDFEITGGVLPTVGEEVLSKVFDKPIQLRNIPEGLHLRSVTTAADGLTARFSGKSVTFRPDEASAA